MIQRVEAGRELTQAALNDLGRALPELISAGVTQIYLDTSRVVEFDSHTLEGILEFDAFARSRGLHVAVVRPSELLAVGLDISGLWERLDVREVAEPVAILLGRAAPAGAPRGAVEDAGEVVGSGDNAR